MTIIQIQSITADIPLGHRIGAWKIVQKGLFIDEPHYVIYNMTTGTYIARHEEALQWVLQGLPKSSSWRQDQYVEGLVTFSSVSMSLGSVSTSLLTLHIDDRKNKRRSHIDAQTMVTPLQAEHSRLFFSDQGLEQHWPAGAVHDIVWKEPFNVVVHRNPPPGYERPVLDVHMRFTQRRLGKLYTVAMTVCLKPSPTVEALPVLQELLPRVTDPELIAKLLKQAKHHMKIHGKTWPL